MLWIIRKNHNPPLRHISWTIGLIRQRKIKTTGLSKQFSHDAETMLSLLMSSSAFIFPVTADRVPVRCRYGSVDQQQLFKYWTLWTADRGTCSPQPLFSLHFNLFIVIQLVGDSLTVYVYAATAWMWYWPSVSAGKPTWVERCMDLLCRSACCSGLLFLGRKVPSAFCQHFFILFNCLWLI